jgi:hypothetical protein
MKLDHNLITFITPKDEGFLFFGYGRFRGELAAIDFLAFRNQSVDKSERIDDIVSVFEVLRHGSNAKSSFLAIVLSPSIFKFVECLLTHPSMECALTDSQ